MEASGAVEVGVLAPGGAEAGVGSTETPPPAPGWITSRQRWTLCFVLSRPPSGLHIPACLFAVFEASASDFLNIFLQGHGSIEVDFKVLIGVFLWNKTFNL